MYQLMILKCSKEAGNSLYPLLKTSTHRVNRLSMLYGKELYFRLKHLITLKSDMFIYKVNTCGKRVLHRYSYRLILLRLWKTFFPQITNGQVHRDLLHMQKLSHWVLGQKSSPIPYCVGQNHSKHQVLMLHDNVVFDSEDKKQT